MAWRGAEEKCRTWSACWLLKLRLVVREAAKNPQAWRQQNEARPPRAGSPLNERSRRTDTRDHGFCRDAEWRESSARARRAGAKVARFKPGVAFCFFVVTRMFAPSVGAMMDGEHAFVVETPSCISPICSLAFQDGHWGCDSSYLRRRDEREVKRRWADERGRQTHPWPLWIKPFPVRTCAVFQVLELFWFCLLQVSTTQFCSFPLVLMAGVDDVSEVLISSELGISSNHGSPNGSGPDLDGIRPSSIDTQYKELRDMLLPLTLGFAEFDKQVKSICEAVGIVTSRITSVEQTINALCVKVALFATMEETSALSLHVYARLKQMQRTPLAPPARQALGIYLDIVMSPQPLGP